MEKQKMNYAELDHKMNNLKKTKENIDIGRKKYLTDDEFEKILHDKLQTLTKDISDMSLEELREFNKIDDENTLIEEPNMDDDTLKEYMQGVFEYMKSSDNFNTEIDELLKEYDHIQEEMNRIVEESIEEQAQGDVIKYLRDTITKLLNIAKENNNKESITKFETMQLAFEDSFKLNRIFDLYKRIGVGNTKIESEKKAGYIYNKYKDKMRQLELKNDLIYLSNLENKFLPEEYHDRNNLFVFIIMKYISKLSIVKGLDKNNDIVFASQITTNLFLLFKNKLKDEDKELLLTNIKRVLDLFK
jgi:hypothetical protein